METDEEFTDALIRNRLLIIQHLQMDRTFLFDYLISKSCFDRTDFELIQAEKTSESKAGRFLDILSMKGESAFYHFIDALQILNPTLYEMLTGESATKRTNPIFSDMKSHIASGGGSIYLDVDILSNFSRRLSEDLQELTLRYDQKIKENGELRKKLEDALSEQTRMQRKIEALEKQVSDTEEALISEAHSSASKVSESLLKRFEVVQREGRTNQFIIQLQMKLLASHEENETLRRQVEDVKASNNELVKQLSKVNVDYAVKKKETTKLSQQLRSQSAEMKSCEGTKQKLREVQFHNAKLRCELQEKESEVLELIEMKHWTEALKARFDLIVAEKKQVLENHEIVDSKCASQLDEISELKMKLNHRERDLEELNRSYKEVEDNSRIYREERDFYCKSVKDAALELEQTRREKEEADQRQKKMLECKELSFRQQAEYGQQFERKYEEAKKELTTVKLKLKQEREQNEELRKKVSRIEAELQQKESALKSYLEEDDSQGDPQSASQTQPSQENEPSGTGNEFALNFWKEREPKEVVGSIIRRLDTNKQKPKEESAKDTVMTKSKSFDEKLAQIIPEFESLPLETRKGCSLDQNMMKENLPYTLLATMYQPMKSPNTSFPDVLSVAMGQSHDSSTVKRRLGVRKMSAPVLTDFLSYRKERGDGDGEGSLSDHELLGFEDEEKEEAQHEFRARTQAIPRRNGERRQRRLTEPALFCQDFSGMEHSFT